MYNGNDLFGEFFLRVWFSMRDKFKHTLKRDILLFSLV